MRLGSLLGRTLSLLLVIAVLITWMVFVLQPRESPENATGSKTMRPVSDDTLRPQGSVPDPRSHPDRSPSRSHASPSISPTPARSRPAPIQPALDKAPSSPASSLLGTTHYRSIAEMPPETARRVGARIQGSDSDLRGHFLVGEDGCAFTNSHPDADHGDELLRVRGHLEEFYAENTAEDRFLRSAVASGSYAYVFDEAAAEESANRRFGEFGRIQPLRSGGYAVVDCRDFPLTRRKARSAAGSANVRSIAREPGSFSTYFEFDADP